MITKSDFANHIIDKFCESERISREKLDEGDILKSSSLGVAFEYLDMIKDTELKKYVSTRGGTFIFISGKNGDAKFLTTRELMNLLPETI